MASGKILVAQGGGPTAVINQSLVGVALEARRFGQVQHIYGARHGVRGIVDEDFVDLTQETSHNLELVANTPSSALGSTRDKPDIKYCQEIFKVLAGAPDRTFLLHRRQRLLRHGAHRQPGGAKGRLSAALHPHPQRPSTTTWSATTTRPAFRRRRALSRRPLPAPTWTTPPCPASMSAS